ncbi:MAG: cobaltochelatase subunit CobN [Azovibrio sp.]|nr:cobaltochelatase subunit CobN [Azovibrio sp.]
MIQLRAISLVALLFFSGAALAQSVLFIATAPVPPGKFKAIAELADKHGLKIEALFAERIPVERQADIFAGFDFVIFDAARPHMQEAIKRRLEKPLARLKTPYIWMQDNGPQASGLDGGLAQSLHAYYTNGGMANFDGFLATLVAYLRGTAAKDIAPPFIFPKSAIYHPDAPGQIFAAPADYFRWKGVDPARRPPTVAINFFQTLIGARQTGFIDDVIRRIEAAGALPLAYYGPVMAAHDEMLYLGGNPVADVLINTQITLNPEVRRKEFERLGIPVIQALAYRKGGDEEWRDDPQGIPLVDVPFYLAQPEYAGMFDAVVAFATRKSDGEITVMPEQSAALVAKAINLIRLQRLPNADKKIAVLFWNYPPGERNLSASFLNVPRSLETMLKAMERAGYDVETSGEIQLINILQRLLSPFYRDGQLEELLRDGLAERLPVKVYRAWLERQPAQIRAEMESRWGKPEKSSMVVYDGDEAYFVIPRYRIGKLVLSPQAPRGERWEDKEKALYHSSVAAPSHYYMAHYLWVREAFKADAIVHYGTHGSQEWLPGKERGLSVRDYPMAAIGDVPVVYPYIVDNIGEALQTKRRGRAVNVTHQTPPFMPAGLHATLNEIHILLHAWQQQDEGSVKEKIADDLMKKVKKERLDKDMGWDDKRIAADFRGFVNELHDHLHELAKTAQPLGLHTLGAAPAAKFRLGTVLLMLGKPYWEAAAKAVGVPDEDRDEAFVGDYEQMAETIPFRLLRDFLDGRPVVADDKLTAMLEQGRKWYADLGAAAEMDGLLSALAGQYRPTSYGGDPMKNPDALPTGRNLYGFDPSRVPTQQAWAAGKEAAEALIGAHRAKTGQAPKKLTFSLWSVETMRHQGLLEAQALAAMGVEPVWDAGGRVVDVKLIPREQLGRARVDIVLSATGLYRDHFPNVMKQLAKAAELAARANEADNPVYANSQRIAASLRQRGVPDAAAQRAAEIRIFSNASGRYGTGLDDAALATDTWKSKSEGDRKLAQLYLRNMQYAFGSDESTWGRKGAIDSEDINLYAEHLKGTEGAVLSRTSNLYGMLTTDDPFQYLGGIGSAVRYLDGKAPELYIANLRDSGAGRIEGADKFLAKELASRNFHPGYIKSLMAEGYSGTLQVLDAMNNFTGWTTVAREIVRDDQWQEFVDVYVRDKHQLGLKAWFEKHNPHALAQTIEKMLEMARHGYWQVDAKTVAELKERYHDLARRFDVKSDNAAFEKFVAPGFGLVAMLPAALSPTRAQSAADLIPPPEPMDQPPIQGLLLQKVESKEVLAQPSVLFIVSLLLLTSFGGGLSTWRRSGC